MGSLRSTLKDLGERIGMERQKHERDDDMLQEAPTLLALLAATYGMGRCDCGAAGLVSVAARNDELECAVCRDAAEADERGKAA